MCDDDRGTDACRTILLDRRDEVGDAESELVVDRHMAHAIRAEPECSQGLHVREVELGAAVDADRAERPDAGQVDVDSQLLADPVARDRQADEVRSCRAAREGRATVRQL